MLRGAEDKLGTTTDCKGKLIFRKGAKKTPHFAHKINPSRCNFLLETEEHLRAKWKVVEMVRNNIQANVVRFCSVCSSEIIQSLFQNAYKAKPEFYLAPYYLDIGLLDEKGELLAAIEIYASHAIDGDKISPLKQKEILWGEFKAEDILKSNNWKPLKDYFKKAKCSRCKLIEQFGDYYPLIDKFSILCPASKNKIDIIKDCGTCNYFEDFDGKKVFCFGKVKRNET